MADAVIFALKERKSLTGHGRIRDCHYEIAHLRRSESRDVATRGHIRQENENSPPNVAESC